MEESTYYWILHGCIILLLGSEYLILPPLFNYPLTLQMQIAASTSHLNDLWLLTQPVTYVAFTQQKCHTNPFSEYSAVKLYFVCSMLSPRQQCHAVSGTSSSAASSGGDGEWKEVDEEEDPLPLIILSSHGSFTCPVSQLSITAQASSQWGAQNVRCTHQICQQAGWKHLLSPVPQPVAIKVLLCCGKRKREATWRSVENPITSLSYTVSKSNSWKQNSSDSPLR